MKRRPVASGFAIFLIHFIVYLYIFGVIVTIRYWQNITNYITSLTTTIPFLMSIPLIPLYIVVLLAILLLIILFIIINKIISTICNTAPMPISYEGSPEKIQISFGEIVGVLSTILGTILTMFKVQDVVLFGYWGIALVHFICVKDSYNFIYMILGYKGYKVDDLNGAPKMIVLTKEELLPGKIPKMIKLTETLYIKEQPLCQK